MSDCFHCGLPVPAGPAYRLAILGAERELCCAGCEAVARTIVEAGLASYYETRSGPVPLPQEAQRQDEFSGNEADLILEGVRCAACLWLIEGALRQARGITGVEVNYTTRRARVAWQDTTLDAVLAAVRAVGYAAHPYEPRAQEALARKERREALWHLFVAAFGAMQVMMYAFPAYVDEVTPEALQLMRWASVLITTPVLFISCRPFFAGALAEIRGGRLGLDTPIALGLGMGFLASTWAVFTGAGEVYFDSISMLAFLLLGARWFESAARERAGRMLDPLLQISCKKSHSRNEEILVAPGERIPADGVVIEGASGVDESLLTGESRPVAKAKDDEVLAGTVNLEQPLRIRVTRAGADTRAAGISRLAERGLASRPRVVEAADRVARHLTGAIVLVAIGAGLYSGGFWIPVAVLVVACPCALALAAPVVLTRASAALLGGGVLMTRARALDALDRATDVVLDKTGTLTTGRIVIAGVTTFRRLEEDECLRLAASLEAASLHPLAGAFSHRRLLAVEQPRAFPGEGVEGVIGGRRYRIGSASFCGTGGASRVYLADDAGPLAAFDLDDELRPDARVIVKAFKERGIAVHLASGDQPAAVRAVASRLGIAEWRAQMTPGEKLDYVAALQARGRVVVMIGDGVNDAPVLARADAAMAIGTGADLAQLHADFVLVKGNLGAAVDAFRLARTSMRLVRQNLAWALAYNALALPLAAIGLIGPWEAAIAMAASSASVLLNASRPLKGEAWKASTSSYPSPSPSYS